MLSLPLLVFLLLPSWLLVSLLYLALFVMLSLSLLLVSSSSSLLLSLSSLFVAVVVVVGCRVLGPSPPPRVAPCVVF